MTWVDITERTPWGWDVHDWLDGVSESGIDWRWDDDAMRYFICFANPEDATMFMLRFGIKIA